MTQMFGAFPEGLLPSFSPGGIIHFHGIFMRFFSWNPHDFGKPPLDLELKLSRGPNWNVLALHLRTELGRHVLTDFFFASELYCNRFTSISHFCGVLFLPLGLNQPVFGYLQGLGRLFVYWSWVKLSWITRPETPRSQRLRQLELKVMPETWCCQHVPRCFNRS